MPAATAYTEVKPAAERLAGQVAADPIPMDAKGSAVRNATKLRLNQCGYG